MPSAWSNACVATTVMLMSQPTFLAFRRTGNDAWFGWTGTDEKFGSREMMSEGSCVDVDKRGGENHGCRPIHLGGFTCVGTC